MERYSRIALFLLIAIGVIAYAIGISGAAAVNDQEFVRKAASGGKMEVRLGEIAMQQASSNEVKNFAQRIINDHNLANQQLTALSERNNLEVPQDLDRQENNTVKELSSKKGRDFDQAYMDSMIQDHRKDLELFQKMAKEGKNPELKNFAQQNIPVLQKHLQLAEQVSSKIKQQG